MTSRSVSLTSTFLLLAAGGVAACDNDDTQDEAFYCADENGTVVDEENCDDDNDRAGGVGFVPLFFIWHSSSYRPGYGVGTKLPAGGNRFAYNDRAARQSFGLPASGRISNGTIKTSVVGKGGGSTGKTTGKSGG
jgi:hypothetical protein